MLRHFLPAALALTVAACSGPQDATPPTPATGDAPAAAASEEAKPAPAPVVTDPLARAVAGDWRSAESVARDVYRHPQQTLGFFDIRPDMRVIEITPGKGWYTEILAPYLRGQGDYIAALVNPSRVEREGARNYYAESNQKLRAYMAEAPAQYDSARVIEFDNAAPNFGEAGSADAVLTFRNVHNWMQGGNAQQMFAAFHAVLKPGGVLGVVEHRADQDVPEGDSSGYVSEAQVIAMASAAGFVLEEKSEINANPNDKRRHPNGVWTLPPANRHAAEESEKYAAIGESDRMTLRFRKPAQ